MRRRAVGCSQRPSHAKPGTREAWVRVGSWVGRSTLPTFHKENLGFPVGCIANRMELALGAPPRGRSRFPCLYTPTGDPQMRCECKFTPKIIVFTQGLPFFRARPRTLTRHGRICAGSPGRRRECVAAMKWRTRCYRFHSRIANFVTCAIFVSVVRHSRASATLAPSLPILIHIHSHFFESSQFHSHV